MKRNREDIVAAAFAASGPGASFDPIRVQKLLFLIDREVAERIGGPFFHFRPYHYGPFDRTIYDVIGRLVVVGDARDDSSGSDPRYLLTKAGYRRGTEVRASFPDPVGDYVARASRWVRLIPYRQMLAAIYRQYPDMAVNSVVRHLGSERPTRWQSPFTRGMTRAFDITGTMHRSPDRAVGLESEAEAIGAAWRAVGDHLEDAMVECGASERLW